MLRLVEIETPPCINPCDHAVESRAWAGDAYHLVHYGGQYYAWISRSHDAEVYEAPSAEGAREILTYTQGVAALSCGWGARLATVVVDGIYSAAVLDGGQSGIWLAARDNSGEHESVTLAEFNEPGRATDAFAQRAEQIADRVELERLTDYSDVAAAHLRYRAALARADVARAILGDVLRRNETEIRNSRNVSSVARGIGVSREFLHRVLNRAEWTWKKVSQAVEPTVRMEGLVTDRQAAVEGSEWIITVTFAVEATGEREARKIVSDVLSHMDMTSDGNPSAERGGDEPWAIEVKLNLSAVPVIEPDDARTRISYVTRNLEGVTWRVIQANEDDALFEWPPHRQASSEWKEVLGNPAIRAATVRASLHVT